MKSYLLSCCLLVWGQVVLAAEEAKVDDVHTFANEAKSSVVIYYSGVPKLRYFAVDSADDVLALDLPDVYSAFDFSEISFDQVTEVVQAPLDPDSSKGISLRFVLRPGVTYEIFDQGAGELTMLFESGADVPASVSTQPVAPPPVDAEAAIEKYAIASDQAAFHEISGPEGETRLSKLMVYNQPFAGRMLLVADGLADYRYFTLIEPQRFVLDLENITQSLESSELILDSPLVTRIRVRQFQTQPTLVTRIVLDLKRDVQVDIARVEDGLILGFASDENRLAEMMQPAVDSSTDPAALPNAEAVAAVDETPSGQETAMASEELTDAPESAGEPLETESVTAADSVALDGTGATAEAEPVMTEHSSTSVDPIETETLVADNSAAPSLGNGPAQDEQQMDEKQGEDLQPSLSSPESQDLDTAAVALAAEPASGSSGEMQDHESAQLTSDEAGTDTDQVSATQAGNEMPVAQEPELVTTDLQDTQVAETALRDEISEVPATQESDSNLADATTPALEQTDVPVSSTQALTAEPAISLPVMEDDQPNVTGSETASESTTNTALTSPVAELEQSPKFTMASDLDLEMQEFLDQSEDKSFYALMKDVKSNRKVDDNIAVTNQTIEEGKKLREMRSMQDTGTQGEDVSALFQEPILEFGAETIEASEPQYQGFEIAIIDVKDADVVDLLRFLAEQVGFNLYVDSSVQNLTATYTFRNIPWDQAMDIILSNANLDKEFRNGVMRVATTEKFRQEELARAALREQRELSVPLETVTFNLNYAKAADVMPLLSEYLSARGKILMDERTNMLIIQDIPKRMTTIRALIKRLDRMIAQVTIEARLVETTKRFLKELGIQWGLSAQYSPETGTETGVDFPNRLGVGGPRIGSTSPGGLAGGYAVNLPVVAENPSGLGLTLGNFLDNFKLDISLQMLESEGFGQIISSPKVTTQNNKTAIIKNGQEVPIQTIQRGTITVRYIEAVLELEVTPHITSDETVIMDVIVDKSEPDFTRTVNGNPVINIRRAETRVLVKNGGTAVIGGIFTLNEQGTDTGIPGLRKVPILKRLFSSELHSYENQELLIFITPRIVKY